MKEKKYVDFDLLLDSIQELDLSSIEWLIENVSYQYYEYIKHFRSLSLESQVQLLDMAWQEELIANQAMEGETKKGHLLEYVQDIKQGQESISKLTNLFGRYGKIEIRDLQRLHTLLLRGTTLEKNQNYLFRSNDQKWVGYVEEDGKPCVQYIPPRAYKIKHYLRKILTYVNDFENVGTIENPKLLYEEYDNHLETYGYSIFVKPTLIHVLLSVLQPFDDGNTRLARLIQEVKIYQETNRLFQLKTSPKRLPYLYLSQRYYQRGPFYRSQMADIAQSPTNENWKSFIYMNLGCVEEEINVMQHTLKYFK